MNIETIEHRFSVCKVENFSEVDPESPFCFMGKTDEEYSLVCLTEHVPQNVLAREDHWRAMRIQGSLDFSLVGILARISGLLAENGIGLFAVSTYNTDYILTKEDNYRKALSVLAAAGYTIV